MLTEEEKKQIDEHSKEYPTKRAACIEALKIVQRNKKWISDDSLEDIADYLDMTVDELDSVATFYSLIFRKPVGRHVILVCDSISCYIVGYPKLYEHLKKTLGISYGETTVDKRFTILPIRCLGSCDHAPALMIDNDLHIDLIPPEKINEILKNYQ